MTKTPTYKRGDTVPLPATLPVDLTDATSVRFHLKDPDGDDIVSGATIRDAENGEVAYQWSEGETDRTGLFDIEWQVTWNTGSMETFPKNGYDSIVFREDIG